LGANNSNTQEYKEKKKLCAVKNPSKRSDQSWFYNIFLGNISKKKPKRNHTKTNWIMKLSENEIKLLKERTCEIIEIENNIKKQLEKDVENGKSSKFTYG